MKYSTIVVFTIWLALTLNCFTQDKIFKEVFSEKFTNEWLQKVHNSDVNVLHRINDIDSLLLKSKNNTWKTVLRNPQREFYEEEGLNAKDTRTTINKKQLGDGFLLIDEYDQYWDSSSSAWVNSWKNSYTYDGNNILTEWLNQYWSGSVWRNNSKTLYTYDGNNILTEELVLQNGPTWKYSYTYDGNNILTEMLAQHLHDSDWVNIYKCLYTYDGNNNLIEVLSHNWDDFGWVISSKYSNKYDGNNNLTQCLRQYKSGSNWVNSEKYSYAYDGNNNLTEYFYQYWNDYDSTWQNLEKYLYTYDANNILTEELYQLGQGFVWENFLKTFYTYDINNNQIEALCFRCDGLGWVLYYRASYTYDGNNNRIEELWQSWDGSYWVNAYKTIYSYLPTDVTEFTGEFNDYSLSNNFPNPFNPYTNIRFQIADFGFVSLKVYDVLGNEVATLVNEEKYPGIYEVEFDGAGLSSSVYIYQLVAGNYIQTRKMVILK